MYGVSAAYLTAKNKSPQIHTFKIAGTIGSTAFTEANILKGSLSITNKCSNGKNVLVGSTTIGELKATFLGVDVAENADITLSEGLKLANGTFEYVPLGVFRVASANISRSGTEVTAYDRMSFFDKSFDLDTTFGKPYDLAMMACKTCGVNIGMTQQQMEALPNGTEELDLYTENDLETWRDLLFWLAQAMGCFATVDRTGQLVFRQFKQTVNDTIDNNKRYTGASFSKFVTKYTSISVYNMSDKSTLYYSADPDDGLVYDIGKNPFLQYNSDNAQLRIRTATLNGILGIAYTPFKAEVNVGALYDLGDIIQHEDGLAENASISCIMKYTWKYNGGYSMEGVGENPALQKAKSKADKAIQSALASMTENKLQFYTFTNASPFVISDGETARIIKIRFAANNPTTCVFNAEVLMDVETTVSGINYNDLKCTVKYRWNGTRIDDRKPIEWYEDGEHILQLMNYIYLEDASIETMEVYLTASGGDISIGAGDIVAGIYGQNLVASDRFNNLEFEEEIQLIPLSAPSEVITLTGLTENITIVAEPPIGDTLEDNVDLIALAAPGTITLLGLTESVDAVLKD